VGRVPPVGSPFPLLVQDHLPAPEVQGLGEGGDLGQGDLPAGDGTLGFRKGEQGTLPLGRTPSTRISSKLT
jgi:hypothetical protein